MPYEKPELKDNILSLACAFPDACRDVIQRLMKTKDGIFKFSVLCDSIGLEYCTQIFDGLSKEQWTEISRCIAQLKGQVSSPQSQASLTLLGVYTLFLSECMAWEENQNRNDPFSFLKRLTVVAVKEVLKDSEPTHIALISLYWKPREFAHLVRLLEPAKRKLIVLQATRLDQVSMANVHSVAQSFAKSLIQKAKCNLELDQSVHLVAGLNS